MRLLALSLSAMFLLLGCAGVTPEEEPTASVTMAALGVPFDELPPPGECRIWIPDQPAKAQAPAGSCLTLAAGMPADAWLLHRPAESPEHVEVTLYNPDGGLASLRYYEATSGRYLGSGIAERGVAAQ